MAWHGPPGLAQNGSACFRRHARSGNFWQHSALPSPIGNPRRSNHLVTPTLTQCRQKAISKQGSTRRSAPCGRARDLRVAPLSRSCSDHQDVSSGPYPQLPTSSGQNVDRPGTGVSRLSRSSYVQARDLAPLPLYLIARSAAPGRREMGALSDITNRPTVDTTNPRARRRDLNPEAAPPRP